jgi:hypothetical protein
MWLLPPGNGPSQVVWNTAAERDASLDRAAMLRTLVILAVLAAACSSSKKAPAPPAPPAAEEDCAAQVESSWPGNHDRYAFSDDDGATYGYKDGKGAVVIAPRFGRSPDRSTRSSMYPMPCGRPSSRTWSGSRTCSTTSRRFRRHRRGHPLTAGATHERAGRPGTLTTSRAPAASAAA